MALTEESNGGTDSTGESVAVLPGTGEVLAGDYWVNRNREPAGHVKVIDPLDPTAVEVLLGDPVGDLCGADVQTADVDASGTVDVVTACLGDLWYTPGALGVFTRDDTGWAPLARVEGTAPFAWFGAPTAGGFDLDHDGLDDLAIGEEHLGPDLDSVVHLISGPWSGRCTLDELGAVELETGLLVRDLRHG